VDFVARESLFRTMPKRTSKPARRASPKKKSRRLLWILAGAAVFLVLLYVVAPAVILKVVNRNLNKNPLFENHAGGLVLHPLRGGYTLQDFAIRRKRGDTLVSIFTARSIDVSLQWRSIARGRPRAKAVLDQPRLNLVPQFFNPKRKKKPGAWQRTFDLFHVFPVDEIRVREGAIHFIDLAESPPVDIHVDAIAGFVTGLTAARGRDSATKLPSLLEVRGRLMRQAPLRLEARMQATASQPTFDLRAELEDFRLAELNGAFRAYARLDVERGEISLKARLRAEDGRFAGRVHREARDLKIFDPEKDNEGFLASTWEAVTDAAGKLVEKRAEPGVSPDLPVSGSFGEQAETWTALGGLLQGTFARALDPRLGKSLGEDAGVRWDSPEVSKARKLLSLEP
jgi:hypothetical protein